MPTDEILEGVRRLFEENHDAALALFVALHLPPKFGSLTIKFKHGKLEAVEETRATYRER